MTEDQELETDGREDGPAYLVFTGPITQDNARELIKALGVCVGEGRGEVHLLLNTFGGNVNAGVFLHNVMKGLPFKLVTHNTGTVASIGVAVYLAGDERRACPGSSFYSHGVSSSVTPGEQLNSGRLKEIQQGIDADQATINRILGERTQLDEDELNRRSESETTIDPETAVDEGIAHFVADVEIPADASYVFTVPVID
jgi:ATP-dependent Clp protease, protease subunit